MTPKHSNSSPAVPVALVCQCGHERGDHQGMGPSRGKPVFSACGACSCNQWRPSPAVSQLAGEKWSVKLVDNAQSGLSWTVIVTFPNGERFEDEFGDGLDAAQSAEDWEKNLGSITSALSEREEKVANVKVAWKKLLPHVWETSFDEPGYEHTNYTRAVMAVAAALSALGE